MPSSTPIIPVASERASAAEYNQPRSRDESVMPAFYSPPQTALTFR
jgi:hypothetical protein